MCNELTIYLGIVWRLVSMCESVGFGGLDLMHYIYEHGNERGGGLGLLENILSFYLSIETLAYATYIFTEVWWSGL